MIFSLAKNLNSFPLKELKGVDIFCFFHASPSVSCPPDLWFLALCSSLRMKQQVLLLEDFSGVFPEWNSKKRWDSGENWCWLSPRALSVISKAYGQNPMNFQEFKLFLKSSK